MTIRSRILWPRILCVVLAGTGLALAAAPPVLALGRCEVAEKKDGTLLVSAKKITGTLRYGTSPDAVEGRFANASDCIADGQATKCVLGEKGSLERTTHPPLCKLFLEDDEDSCTAKVAGCTPGLRPTCPPDMERVGATCIDRTFREGEFGEAIADCHARGRDLCTANQLMACDVLNVRAGEFGSCGYATDTSNDWSWTLTSNSEGGENVFNEIHVYRGDNLIHENPTNIGSIYNYFCCAPLGTP